MWRIRRGNIFNFCSGVGGRWGPAASHPGCRGPGLLHRGRGHGAEEPLQRQGRAILAACNHNQIIRKKMANSRRVQRFFLYRYRIMYKKIREEWLPVDIFSWFTVKKRGMWQLFSFATTKTRQRFRTSVTSINTKHKYLRSIIRNYAYGHNGHALSNIILAWKPGFRSRPVLGRLRHRLLVKEDKSLSFFKNWLRIV